MTLSWPWPTLAPGQFWFLRHLNGKSWFFSIVLYGKEMRYTSLHMNARGQGHLLTFAKVTWVKTFFSKNTTRLSDSTFHINPIFDEKRNGSQIVLVKWPRWPPCSKMLKTFNNLPSPELLGQLPWFLVFSIRDCSTTKFVKNKLLGWPWPNLWQGQIWFHRHLNGKNAL